jgi:hypothetical protein
VIVSWMEEQGKKTYMAVLCVRMVFSFNSKSWNLAGSRTLREAVVVDHISFKLEYFRWVHSNCT